MSKFKKPVNWVSYQGKPRRAGFEFEFTDLQIEQCASLVQKLFGGKVEWSHSHQAKVNGSEIGKVKIELDFRLLQQAGDKLENVYPEKQPKWKGLFHMISRLLGFSVRNVVPVEISTAPLQWEQFECVEKLRKALRKKKKGGGGIFNAYGLHINPEVPSLDSEVLLNYIRSFILFYPWLNKEIKPNLSRRFLSYIDAFPYEYQKKVMEKGYASEKLIQDYMEMNPTRNRPLDMIPIFCFIDDSVVETLPDNEKELVQARPAFHYRLPNCNLDTKDWSVKKEWNYWCLVDDLANDVERLARFCRMYAEHLEHPIDFIRKEWASIWEREYGL